MKTHDYTVRRWGHDYTFEPIDDAGIRGKAFGWGVGIQAEDFLLLRNGSSSTRYRVESIEYFADPADMWRAQLVFAPRPA